LNPVPHIDPFGSIVMPALGALTGIPIIAWAKPVPVNPMRMRHPRRDLVFVSLAGPASNLIMMTIAALAARQLYLSSAPNVRYYEDLPTGILILFSFAVVNLLPIPPLDGSALLERLLPGEWLPHWYRFRPYGFLVLFLLVFSTGIFSKLFDPLYNRLFDFVFR
jgi:Zn-dependent protease